jgi:hypothetical protein
VAPAIHLVLVIFVAATFWRTYLPSSEANANIGAALVLIVLAVMASPWSWPVELWWPDLDTGTIGLIYTVAAVTNVALHSLILGAMIHAERSRPAVRARSRR